MSLDISLPQDLETLVRAKIESGRYNSAAEVVRDALRLLDQQERGEADVLAWLRQAWREGLESGPPGEIDFEALKQEARSRMAGSH